MASEGLLLLDQAGDEVELLVPILQRLEALLLLLGHRAPDAAPPKLELADIDAGGRDLLAQNGFPRLGLKEQIAAAIL